MRLQHADCPEGPWVDVPAGQAATRPYVRRRNETEDEQGDREAHERLELRRADRRVAESTWLEAERRKGERRAASLATA